MTLYLNGITSDPVLFVGNIFGIVTGYSIAAPFIGESVPGEPLIQEPLITVFPISDHSNDDIAAMARANNLAPDDPRFQHFQRQLEARRAGEADPLAAAQRGELYAPNIPAGVPISNASPAQRLGAVRNGVVKQVWGEINNAEYGPSWPFHEGGPGPFAAAEIERRLRIAADLPAREPSPSVVQVGPSGMATPLDAHGLMTPEAQAINEGIRLRGSRSHTALVPTDDVGNPPSRPMTPEQIVQMRARRTNAPHDAPIIPGEIAASFTNDDVAAIAKANGIDRPNDASVLQTGENRLSALERILEARWRADADRQVDAPQRPDRATQEGPNALISDSINPLPEPLPAGPSSHGASSRTRVDDPNRSAKIEALASKMLENPELPPELRKGWEKVQTSAVVAQISASAVAKKRAMAPTPGTLPSHLKQQPSIRDLPLTQDSTLTSPIAMFDGWTIEVACGWCEETRSIVVDQLLGFAKDGEKVASVIGRLSCRTCGAAPTWVQLCENIGADGRQIRLV